VTSRVDKDLIDLLVKREGTRTAVVLRDTTRLSVLNIAWGYDDGDPHAHVTTNISPSVPEASVDFFSTQRSQRWSIHTQVTLSS
jgi:hypothetical protein